MDWIEDGQWSEKMIIDSLFSVSVHVGYGGFDNYNGFSNYCFGNGMFDDRIRGDRGRGKRCSFLFNVTLRVCLRFLLRKMYFVLGLQL